MTETEQAQVGDTVRVTHEGVVTEAGTVLAISGYLMNSMYSTVEILSRATPPLPSEPDIYREIDARLITSSGQFEVNISGDYGSHSGPIGVTSEQTRRILAMLSAEASRLPSELLPSEPGTFWLDKDDGVWQVNDSGRLSQVGNPCLRPSLVAPFRQLVVKEES